MKKYNVLLIDDVKVNLHIIKDFIKSNFDDINIIEAYSIEKAYDVISKKNIDIIISDITVADITDFDFASYILDGEESKYIPMILATDIKSDIELTKECFGSCIEIIDYISKPIDNKVLYKKFKLYKDVWENKNEDRIINLDKIVAKNTKKKDYNNLLNEEENFFDIQRVLDDRKRSND